jgi:AcrR family transcriptional regulator
VPKIAEQARAARRDQIIAAAAECFARSGYHLTTVADIAEAAGVSKGTPYLYFAGKEALFIALYEEWDCGLAARVDAAVGGGGAPPPPGPRAPFWRRWRRPSPATSPAIRRPAGC